MQPAPAGPLAAAGGQLAVAAGSEVQAHEEADVAQALGMEGPSPADAKVCAPVTSVWWSNAPLHPPSKMHVCEDTNQRRN